MNKIYKVVYNKARNCYVVVSEIAKTAGKSTSGSKKKMGALLCALALSGGFSVYAEQPNVTYDDEDKTSITLNVDNTDTTVDIKGVKGGEVYEGSTHVATGNDVWTLKNKVDGFSTDISTINSDISKINKDVSAQVTKITNLTNRTSTLETKVARGYAFQINGLDVRTATPNDNEVNFENGDHITITDDNGSLKFSVQDDGVIEENNTGLVTGGTVASAIADEVTNRNSAIKTAVDAEKTAREGAIGTITGKVNYITADGSVSSNLTALDSQVKTNADNITSLQTSVASDLDTKANKDASNIDTGKYAEKLGTGKVIANDTNLVTGGTVANAISTKADTDLGNLTDGGKNVIKNLSKETVKLADGTYTTVSSDTDNEGNITYKVNVTANGKIANGDTGLVTGGTVASAIADEVTNRNNAIKTAVDAEKTARESAIGDINTKIGTITGDVNYITADGTISNNLTALDSQIKTNADNITKNKDAITNLKTSVASDLDTKANKDASNIDTGKYAEKLGTGKVIANDTNLVTGGTVANAISTKADTDLGNLTDGGKNVIKNLSKETVKLADGTYTTVSSDTDNEGNITYKVNVTANGKVANGDTGLVTGGTVASAIADEVTNRNSAIKTAVDTEKTARESAIGTITGDVNYITADGSVSSNLTALDKQVKTNADAIDKNKDAITNLQNSITTDLDTKANKDASNIDTGKYAEKLGTGKVIANDTNLVTGGTVANAISTKADTDLGNLTDGGKNVIKNLSKDSIKLVDGTYTTVSSDTDDAGNITYKVNVTANGKVANGDTGLVTGGTVASAIADEVTNRNSAIKTAVDTEKTARETAITEINDKIGSISGDVHYITADGTISNNLTALDSQVYTNTTNIAKNTSDIAQEIQDRKNAITEITNNISSLDGNVVKYDDETKTSVTFGKLMADGKTREKTKLTNLLDASLEATSTDAVTGAQLYASNKRISTNTADIKDLSSKLKGLQTDISTNSTRLDSLNTSITSINSNVTETLANLSTAMDSSANTDLSNLSEDGKASLNSAVRDAVQNYMKNQKNTATQASEISTMNALPSSAIAVYASQPSVVYDDDTQSSITLGSGDTTVDIKGVKGGEVYQGSTHVATGDDVWKVSNKVDGFQSDINTINTSISSINNLTSSHTTKIKNLENSTATLTSKVNRGYSFEVNGLEAKNATPNNNAVNFVDGNYVSITDEDGDIRVSVTANGVIAKDNTGLITGDTAYKALEEKANKDLSNLSAEAKNQIRNAVAADLSTKANVDASNIDAGKFAKKLGTGIVTDGDTNLVTGGTVYDAIKNLQGGTGGLITKTDVGLGNISNDGKTVIKNLAKDSVKLADGKYTTVSSETDTEGNRTYKVNVTADGAIEDGNTGLITGDTAKKALDAKANKDLDNISEAGKEVIKDTMKDDLDAKANTDLSNLSEEGKNLIKNTLADDLNNKANADASNVGKFATEWATAIGTGKVEKGNMNLVTGDTVYNAVSVKADKSYVDEELGKKANISDVNTALAGKANSDLSNITDAGKNVIKDTMKADLDRKADKDYVDNALSGKVDKSDFNTVKNQVELNKEAIAGKADKSYVDSELSKKANADDVYTKEETNKQIDTKIDSVKDSITGDLNNKANIDGSNIEKDKWQTILGDGKAEQGNTGLVTGDTLHNALDGLAKDGVGLVRQDGDILKVGSDSSASKVDFKGVDKDGNAVNRVLTGIKTDEEDMSSATNVGYVQGVASGLENQMNYMDRKLSNDIKEAGAVASALAGLHHIDYDPDNKLDFAVSTAGYRGKSAAALGAFYQPNENIMFSLAGTIGSSHNAWNAGISFKIGQGSDSPVLSRRVLGNRVTALAQQNQLLAEQNAKLEQDMRDMQNKMNRILAAIEMSKDVQKDMTAPVSE